MRGWFGDGIVLIDDPVRVILVDKAGNVYAATEVGVSPQVDCKRIDDCWASVDVRKTGKTSVWHLSPAEIGTPSHSNTFGGPESWQGGNLAFKAAPDLNRLPWELHPAITYLLFFGLIYIAWKALGFVWKSLRPSPKSK